MQLSLENPLWNFALAVYPEPGVSDECIALQDRHGLDVDLLLFCAYAGGIGVTLTADDIADASAAAADWHREIVRPLRAVRRALKPVEADAAQALRTAVKNDELTAEQIELAMLWGWSRQRLAGRPAGDRAGAIEANVATLLARHGATGGAPNLVLAALRRPTEI